MAVLPKAQRAIPMRAGAGLRPAHFAAILETNPDIGFFEVHALSLDRWIEQRFRRTDASEGSDIEWHDSRRE
jgi:hypothetical protein